MHCPDFDIARTVSGEVHVQKPAAAVCTTVNVSSRLITGVIISIVAASDWASCPVTCLNCGLYGSKVIGC